MVVKNKLKKNLLIIITLTVLIIYIQPVLADSLITIDEVSSPTNTDFQIVSGTMSSGARVIIDCESATVGEKTETSDTTWSANISGMQEGKNLITAIAIDGERTNSTTATIILDKTPPEIEINNVNSPTKNNSQIINGTIEKGAVVAVSCQSAVVGTVSNITNTTWSVDITGMTEGDNVITVTATDEVDNIGSRNTTIILDNTPPDITINVTSPTNINSQLVSGTMEPGSTIIAYSPNATVDDADYPDDETWQVPISGLQEGNNEIFINATDMVGNTASASETIVLDMTPPTITSLYDKKIKKNDTDKYITWIITDTYPGHYWIKNGENVIEPYESGIEVKAQINTSALGDWTYIICANDTVGNKCEDEVIITIQKTAPLKITSPANETTIYSDNTDVSGHVEGIYLNEIYLKPEVKITVNTSNTSENATLVLNDKFAGTYSTSISLKMGTNIITVTAKYNDDNSESRSVIVTREEKDEIKNPARPGGSGGGGGSSGGTSSEEFDNILFSETVREFVSKEKDVSYNFNSSNNILRSINFTPLKTKGEIPAKIEILKDTSSLVNYAPLDKVYKNLNIWIGSFGFATPQNIANAIITFKVNKSWITENKISTSTIKLNRYNKSEWEPLITNQIGHDADHLYFESKTSAFSPFVVTGKEEYSGEAGEEGMTVTPDVTEDEIRDNISGDNTSSAKENNGSSGFIIIIICLLSLGIVIFIMRKKEMI